ncbi:uncharacterized protein F4822DRAFT_114556 [Hypoxylon trugodes]|uniref:uncharacterized protein n=1 Tax=Hypoxylon trugodes TaxID=326681 RepID=UPI00218D0316|nr:uncharacterized protein F4822DRAFT_114556 [Hypoxylon trugodes]KAI1392059.1 hypothetical protein F4822DRAFT_114556 [Hypoxylon trugodes]
MTTKARHGPGIICAESIAALHFLHDIPVLPSSNTVTDLQSRSAGYTLSFEKERSLAGTLAFLAYPKDDVDRIPAVCIEEGPNATYLNALLAINKANSSSGAGTLLELKRGFEGIFSLLGQLDHGACNVENDVFKAIVAMCSRRILHRLRLVRNRGKQSIKEVLPIALDHFRHIKRSSVKTELLPVSTEFVKGARELLKLVNSWVQYQTDSRLEELVEGIRRLRQAGDLRALFDTMSNYDMAPTLRSHLLNMISKVARYRESARFLYRIAKKVPLARKMHIIIAQFPDKAFERALINDYTPKLQTTVSSIEGLETHENNLTHIFRSLNKGEKQTNRHMNQKKADNLFTEQALRTLQDAKVHAEIQLIYYCELHIPQNRLPRVICSSKDACWLCNEFILMYEKMHMPKSHGKLYPQWRLPALANPEFDTLARGYNKRLKDALKSSLKTLFVRQGRTVYPSPNESNLLTLILSDSTLSTVSLPLSDSKREKLREVVQKVAATPATVPEAVSKVTPEATPEKPSSHESALADDEESEETLAPAEEVPLEETSSRSSEPISDMPECPSIAGSSETLSSVNSNPRLERGEVRSKGVRIGKSSPLYSTDNIEIQIEYAGTPTAGVSDRLQKKLSCAIEWLNPDDARKLRDRGEVPIRLEALDGEMDYNVGEYGYVYLSNGDAVLKLFMQPVAASEL